MEADRWDIAAAILTLAIMGFVNTRMEIATKWLNYHAKKLLRRPWACIDGKLIDMAPTGGIWRRLMS